ncbi:MAG TPA: AAA family ATPase [Elusimicrobia bacterium]|nr:AAA family ATPase [Elusimicrobiota bacterium]
MPTTPQAKEHFERLLELLEVERAAEREEARLQAERVPAAEREALGKTITRLALVAVETAEGGYPVLTLTRAASKGQELSPFHSLDQGDSVRLTFPPFPGGGSQAAAFVHGTVERVEEGRCEVAVDGAMPPKMPPGKLTLDILGSDATHRRMCRALSEVSGAQGTGAARLRDILLGALRPEAGKRHPVELFDGSLNEWQRRAVESALAAQDLALIHGPPGTGKTTALVEVIRQAVRRGQRVLATAPSNVAVDNLLERLLPQMDRGLRVVRLGHPARTLESLRRGNLRIQLVNDPQYRQVEELDAERDRLLRTLGRRGASTPLERRRVEIEARRLWKEARLLEQALTRHLIASAQVVLSTHGGLSRRQLRGGFDLVALDEASQATEPLSWIALLLGKKAVFAGDPMQLPPTLHSRTAAKELGVTLFERFQALLPDSMQTLLRTQYRMHETLMAFSSAQFYEGKLEADASVRAHLACQLEGVRETPLTSVPLVFVDTAGTGFEECVNLLLQSRENEGEARLAAKLLQELLDAGLRPKDIAVLSPYAAQVRLLKTLIRSSGTEVGTVDGFQGREKEAVLVSLTRSNDAKQVGFLAETRRMNVTLTRARRLLIVIGDSVTISNHPFYRQFLDFIEKRGQHRSAWEWTDA